MKRGLAGLLFIVAIGATSAHAQTSRSASPVYPGGVYLWTDGSYQSVTLPSVANFGVQGLASNSTITTGSEKHDPRLSGYGIAGGLGYAFADGTFSPLFGSNVRVEIGGRYIQADGTSFAQSVPVTNVNLTALPLTGVAFGVAGCGGATCFTQSTLWSQYKSWDMQLNARSDFRSGAWTVSPLVGIIMGRSETDQSLSQQVFANGAPYPMMGYGMNAALKWNDLGAQVGVGARYYFTSAWSAELNGSIGLVHRSASMSANSAILFGALVPRLSAVQDDVDTTSALGTVEAGLTAHVMPGVTLRGFAGLRYDSSVPGIAEPRSVAFATTGIPAHIEFQSTTSYYAGGGLIVSLAP